MCEKFSLSNWWRTNLLRYRKDVTSLRGLTLPLKVKGRLELIHYTAWIHVSKGCFSSSVFIILKLRLKRMDVLCWQTVEHIWRKFKGYLFYYGILKSIFTPQGRQYSRAVRTLQWCPIVIIISPHHTRDAKHQKEAETREKFIKGVCFINELIYIK